MKNEMTMLTRAERKERIRANRAREIRRKKCYKISGAKYSIVYSRIFYILATACIIYAALCTVFCVFVKKSYDYRIKSLTDMVYELQETNEALLKEKDENIQVYDDTISILEETVNIAVELDKQNMELVDQINDLKVELDQYKEREELFDKYEYALIRENGTRTDITYNDIENIQSLASEKGMSDEVVDLVFSLTMTESRGTQTAKNSESSASGYGQIIQGTGKFIYEKLMGNGSGTYHHSMALDGSLNLEMMLYYLEYLGDKYSNNITLVMNEYRGNTDSGYNKKVDSYLAKAGTSLNSIVIRP